MTDLAKVQKHAQAIAKELKLGKSERVAFVESVMAAAKRIAAMQHWDRVKGNAAPQQSVNGSGH